MLPQVGRLIRWPGGAGKYMMDNVDLMDLMDRMDGMGQSKNGKRVRTDMDIMPGVRPVRNILGAAFLRNRDVILL